MSPTPINFQSHDHHLLTTFAQYECSAFIIDTWIDSVAPGRSNYTPSKLPWEVMRLLIQESYGGKVDDEEDFQTLARLVAQVMTPAAFEDNHHLVEPQSVDDGDGDGDGGRSGQRVVDGLVVPAGTSVRDFLEWINRLPEREPPVYLGLPANADRMLLVGQARSTIKNLQYISGLLDEGEHIMRDATEVA